MSETSVVASLITAVVAVIGITTTAAFSFLQRRDSLRNAERANLQEAARQMTEKDHAKRAAGIGSAARQLSMWWSPGWRRPRGACC
jgi:hypothetical protein